MQHPRTWPLAAALLLAPAALHGQDAVVVVPRAPAPVLDARLAPGEWVNAAVFTLTDGSELRLQHDGSFLYLAMRASARGFPSVCVSEGDVVHVLHASAALGHGEYRRTGAQWSVRTPFTFGLRTRESTPAADAEREAYLREHGWLATTMYQGDRVQKEMQIPLSFLGTERRVALAFMRDSPAARAPSATWPARLDDGCASARLVRGFAEEHPRFEPARWMRLRMSP